MDDEKYFNLNQESKNQGTFDEVNNENPNSRIKIPYFQAP